MKKNIVIHTGNLSVGGQEKMTIEFLKVLSPEKYNIKLLIEEDRDELNIYEKEIPSYVEYEFLNTKKFIKKMLQQKRSKNPFKKIQYSINLIRKKNIAIQKFEKYMDLADIIIDYNNGLLRNLDKLKNPKNIPIIAWNHLGNGKVQRKRTSEENMMRYSAVVTINEKMENGFKENYGKKGLKIERIDNFIDEDMVKEKAKEMYSEKIGEYILGVGALTDRKNFSELIKAFEIFIKEKNSDINLVIIGEGLERKKLENQIEKLDLKDRVFLLGRKENPYPYIKNSKTFILPSIEEGFPIVMMEAMILGKVVIGKRNSGNIEVLKNGKNGILLDNLSKELPSVLEKILGNNEFKEKYEKLSLERAVDFSKRLAKKKIDELIEKYTQNKRS